jgi:uridine kinase
MTVPSFIIAIAGGTGAGKTTVAQELTDGVDSVTYVPLDNYYYSRSNQPHKIRRRMNYDHPDAFDWPLIHEQVTALCEGQSVEMPQYDFSLHDRKDDRITVEAGTVVIIEGILALHDEYIANNIDLGIYVETDADVRILRRIRRDVVQRGRDLEAVIDQYITTVKPMHNRFVLPSKNVADIIIPEGGDNGTAISLLQVQISAVVAAE